MTPRGDIVGERLTARVVRIEHYGLYLAYGEATILVLIVDVSHRPIADLREEYRIGEQVEVRVLRYVAEHGIYKGTIVGGDRR